MADTAVAIVAKKSFRNIAQSHSHLATQFFKLNGLALVTGFPNTNRSTQPQIAWLVQLRCVSKHISSNALANDSSAVFTQGSFLISDFYFGLASHAVSYLEQFRHFSLIATS